MNSAFVGFAVATCLSLFPGNTFATNPPLDQPSSVKQGRVDGSGDLLEQYGGSIPSDVTAVFGEGGILSLMWLLAELWFLRVGWAKRWRPRAPRRDMYGLRLGWCQALAATVCARAGASGASLRMAYEAWLKLGVSKSKAGIPVGATVYTRSWPGSHGNDELGVWWNDFGHGGIYTGNGKVASFRHGSVWIEDLTYWTDWDGW